MAFTVPVIEPAQAINLAAGDSIQSASINSLVLRDRFIFANRRRVIASLGLVRTSAASYETAYALYGITLPTSSDTLLVGVIALDDCTVRITTIYGNVIITTGGPGSLISALSGIPQATWFSMTVEVQSNTGSEVTIPGIYIAEQVLTAADLP